MDRTIMINEGIVNGITTEMTTTAFVVLGISIIAGILLLIYLCNHGG